MLELVPWDSSLGYTSMLRQNKSSKTKGTLHVCCLNYGVRGFHGKGMYIGDVVTWLEHLQLPVNINCLDVVPVMMPSNNIASASVGAPTTLSNFGYGADSFTVNGTIICGLVALVLYAVVHKVRVPSALVKTLQGIQALYTRSTTLALGGW